MKIVVEMSDLTDQNVADLLECAGYGIGYWAQTVHMDTEAKTYRVVESSTSAGSKPADKTLTFDDIRTAFIALNAADQLPAFQIRELIDNDLSFDSAVGDITVQQAMFGEITYG